MVGYNGRNDLIACEKFFGLPGVFCGNQVNFLEGADGSQGDVFHVANGSGYYKKGPERRGRGLTWFISRQAQRHS